MALGAYGPRTRGRKAKERVEDLEKENALSSGR